MAKISEANKNNITVYAKEADVRLDLADICISTAEVEAVIECLHYIDEERAAYHFAKHSAPSDATRLLKSFNKSIKGWNISQSEEELEYHHQIEPFASKVKHVKARLKKYFILVLKGANVGDIRMMKMIPLLFQELYDEDKIPTLTDEEAEQLMLLFK